LVEQLDITNTKNNNDEFRSIDQIYTRNFKSESTTYASMKTENSSRKKIESTQEMKGAGKGGEGRRDPDNKLDGDRSLQPISGYGIEQTSLDKFRAMNDYRENIRSELMQTLLDDRHDIEGNTLYRLSYYATILSGRNTNKLAVIRVTLSHNYDTKNKLNMRSYEQTYSDWVTYTEQVVHQGVDAIAGALTLNAENYEPALMSSFANYELCEVTRLLIAQSGELSRGCGGEEWSNSPELQALTNAMGEEIGRRSKDKWVRRLDLFRALKESLLEKVRTTFGSDEATIKEYGSEVDAALKQCAISQENARGGIVLKDKSDRSVQAPCPNVEESGVNVERIELLFKILVGVRNAEILGKMRAENPRTLKEAFERLVELAGSDAAVRRIMSDEFEPGRRRCVAGEYYKWFFSVHRAGGAQLTDFLNIENSGFEYADCAVRVSPKILGTDGRPVVLSFMEALDRNDETFVYNVEPRNFVQRVWSTLDATQVMRLALAANSELASKVMEGSFLEKQADVAKAAEIRDHAILLPLGEGTSSLRESSPYAVSFGWAIAPRIRGGQIDEHIDGTYSLAAVISIPSWWRSVDVSYETCWVDRGALEPNRAAGSDWTGESIGSICGTGTLKPRVDTVRLPFTQSEISRKLGFELLTVPHLDAKQTPQALRVGHAGDLLLTGGRLWRSTEVFLNSQRADRISVLPDMQGIVAHFNCVLPDDRLLVPRDTSDKIYPHVVVFTSEGRADNTDFDKQISLIQAQDESNLTAIQRCERVAPVSNAGSP
jgi:hypothetical protein